MPTPSNPNPKESNKMSIGPGTRKHAEGASIPGIPARTNMPEWCPELLDSLTRQVGTGRSQAIAAANQKMMGSYRDRAIAASKIVR